MKHWFMLWGMLAVSTVCASDESFQPSSEPSSSRSSSLSVSPSLSPGTPEESPLKKQKIASSPSRWLMREHAQVYAIPTYDATFKYLLSDKEICLSFLRAFLPDQKIQHVTLENQHLQPFQEFQQMRTLINDEKITRFVEKVNLLGAEEKKNITVTLWDDGEAQTITHGDKFVVAFAKNYGDLLRTYPKPERNSQVDILCRLGDGSHAIVEVQVLPEDYWDQRALSYAARMYGRQLGPGDNWKDIRKVICINILGGGPDRVQWDSKPSFQRYTFKNDANEEIEDGIEILQYPLYQETLREIADAHKRSENKTAFLEWLEFLENAANKREEDVENVQTESVRKAYEKIKSENLPEHVQRGIRKQDKHFLKRFSKAFESLREKSEQIGIEKGEQIGIQKGREQEKKDMAREMLTRGLDENLIAEITKLPLEQIQTLQEERP